MNTVNEWAEFFRDQQVPEDLILRYLPYIERLLTKNVPIIFEGKHLRKLLGIESSMLRSLVFNGSAFYRSFSIPKRSGGERTITAPYPELANAQAWIKQEILDNLKATPSATAYVQGKSILENANEHVGKKMLLKLDVEDFFGSIDVKKITAIFESCGYTNKVSYLLASICTLDGSLPQGAPTSPQLSNLASIPLDNRIHALAKKLELTYTRYADDIALSGEFIHSNVISYVEDILKSEGLKLNSNKTQLKQPGKRKILTGISVSSEKPMIPRAYKRQLRAEVFNALHKAQHELPFDPLNIERLIGKLNFVLHVEPENQFARRSLEALKQKKIAP
ncbi:MAG: retron St85 family RNA-directed DNA polymerase [Pseudomonadales bacterium]|nr:retron St85 family RNA-directed DNA polymerase [Pseudomonadales bacterium]